MKKNFLIFIFVYSLLFAGNSSTWKSILSEDNIDYYLESGIYLSIISTDVNNNGLLFEQTLANNAYFGKILFSAKNNTKYTNLDLNKTRIIMYVYLNDELVFTGMPEIEEFDDDYIPGQYYYKCYVDSNLLNEILDSMKKLSSTSELKVQIKTTSNDVVASHSAKCKNVANAINTYQFNYKEYGGEIPTH